MDLLRVCLIPGVLAIWFMGGTGALPPGSCSQHRFIPASFRRETRGEHFNARQHHLGLVVSHSFMLGVKLKRRYETDKRDMHGLAPAERQARHGFGRFAIGLECQECQDSGFRARTTRGMDCRSSVTQTSSHECNSARTLSAMVPLTSMTNQPPGRRADCA